MASAVTSRQSALTERGEATRARIVAAAAELIAVRGVAGTSLDDVRRATATSKSQLYHYFSDKTDLVRAVIAHQRDVVLREQRLADEPLDSVTALRSWRYRTIAAQRAAGFARGCRLGRLAAELTDDDGRTRAALAEAFAAWRAALATGLTTMIDRGHLPPSTDADLLASSLLSAVQGGLVQASVEGRARPLQDALDQVIERIVALAEAQEFPTTGALVESGEPGDAGADRTRG